MSSIRRAPVHLLIALFVQFGLNLVLGNNPVLADRAP
jgi:hypothetical protein